MTTYDVREESGATTKIEATDYAEAVELGREWVQGGDYPDGYKAYVPFWVKDVDGDEYCYEALVGTDPKEPECATDHEHEWESPEWLGGCRENSGVWGLSGTQLVMKTVCKHCGWYRKRTTESTPGQLPREPERIEYLEPDEESLNYVEQKVEK
jgi:hypothetical protein